MKSFLLIMENGRYLDIHARVSTTVLLVVYAVIGVILAVKWWRK